MPWFELHSTCSDEARLISRASLSRSTELLDSSTIGKFSTQSELSEDMSPAKVPRKYLSLSPFYQSKGTELFLLEHVVEPEKALKRQKKKTRKKGKGKEITTSWNKP